jgi:hypothetical protein
MRQVDLTAAQHLLSPFSNPFFGLKFLHGYGLRLLFAATGQNKHEELFQIIQ